MTLDLQRKRICRDFAVRRAFEDEGFESLQILWILVSQIGSFDLYGLLYYIFPFIAHGRINPDTRCE